MLFDYPYFRNYLMTSLEETPRMLRYVLSNMTDEQANARIDPDRFTLREAVAHLADWDGVFRERMDRMVNEDNPVLPDIDEGERAIERGYDRTDWREQLDLLSQRRADMIAYLNGLSIEGWHRTGVRPEIGAISVGDLANLMVIHDVYHIKQAREYLTA